MIICRIQKYVSSFLIFSLFGCGLGNGSGGHDPNKPLPVLYSDRSQVLVNHEAGAVIMTPDGKASLSIAQTALNADTSFEIDPYSTPTGTVTVNLPHVDEMYKFTPETVSALISGQTLAVTIWYDERLNNLGPETNLRLGLYDPVNNCWLNIFLDSPAIIPGTNLHHVTSRTINLMNPSKVPYQLGIFGITTLDAPNCP